MFLKQWQTVKSKIIKEDRSFDLLNIYNILNFIDKFALSFFFLQ